MTRVAGTPRADGGAGACLAEAIARATQTGKAGSDGARMRPVVRRRGRAQLRASGESAAAAEAAAARSGGGGAIGTGLADMCWAKRWQAAQCGEKRSAESMSVDEGAAG